MKLKKTYFLKFLFLYPQYKPILEKLEYNNKYYLFHEVLNMKNDKIYLIRLKNTPKKNSIKKILPPKNKINTTLTKHR